LTLRVVDVPSADAPATVVSQDLGQISEHEGTPWPLCATCGKAWHDSEGLVSSRGVYLCDACLKHFASIRGI
jgi:hypothetical protein